MGDTSTPLRLLEDPVLAHVMPSAATRRSSAHLRDEPGTLHMVREDMAPPPPRFRTAAQIQTRASTVLPEDAYTAGVEAVIEREFFPALPRLRQQMEWLDALRSGDIERIAQARAALAESVRRADAVVGTPTPHVTSLPRTRDDDAASWSAALDAAPRAIAPSSLPPGSVTAPASVAGSDAAAAAASARAAAAAQTMTLDDFQAAFTSEDTASFMKNMDAYSDQRARSHWWVHAHADPQKRKYMRTDGHAQRAVPAGSLGDASVQGVALLEDAYAAVQSWPYRPTNALFFPPDLTTNNAVSGVTDPAPNPDLRVDVREGERMAELLADTAPRAMLSDGAARRSPGGGLLEDGARRRRAGAVVQERSINLDATRLGAALRAQPPEDEHSMQAAPSALQPPTVNGYSFVATPLTLPTPAASPTVTDAELLASVRRDLADTPAPDGTPTFQVPTPSSKEVLANEILATATAKKRARENGDMPPPSQPRKLAAEAVGSGLIAASLRNSTPAFAATPTPGLSTRRGALSVAGPAPTSAGSVSGRSTASRRSASANRIAALPPAAQAVVRRLAANMSTRSGDATDGGAWNSFAGDASLRQSYS